MLCLGQKGIWNSICLAFGTDTSHMCDVGFGAKGYERKSHIAILLRWPLLSVLVMSLRHACGTVSRLVQQHLFYLQRNGNEVLTSSVALPIERRFCALVCSTGRSGCCKERCLSKTRLHRDNNTATSVSFGQLSRCTPSSITAITRWTRQGHGCLYQRIQ